VEIFHDPNLFMNRQRTVGDHRAHHLFSAIFEDGARITKEFKKMMPPRSLPNKSNNGTEGAAAHKKFG